MTLFAGIFNRNRESALPESACETMRHIVSRGPQQDVSVFKDDRCFLVKVDIGAYGEAALRVDEGGSVSMMAGESLLTSEKENISHGRAYDLKLLHESWLKGSWEMLRQATGVFCAAHYNRRTEELCLIADKLCLRPLYYWANDSYVVFATALRILEGLELVPKRMDLRAVTEIVGFVGFPLAARTPYANVSLLRAAEVVRFSARDTSHQQYWRWDTIAPSARPEEELAGEAHERFKVAVARRLGSDTTASAFLSGGLDSRSVVGALQELDVHVRTFNFSPSGSQDQAFGAEFARRMGSVHYEVPGKAEGGPDWAQMLVDASSEAAARDGGPAAPLKKAWSGDGGSVALGHVYMSSDIVDLMRKGKIDAAIEAYLRDEMVRLPDKLFQDEVGAVLSGVLNRGIREEIDDIICADPGRSFHLFLMLNDQRRHLAKHFENIDLHRLELHLPFYDSNFISFIMSVPIDFCLSHKFYTKFLARFPSVVTSVPWQTYPGHDPCPLPTSQALSYQWGAGREPQKRKLVRQAGKMLAADDFPEKIFNKRRFRLAALLHRIGVRDYGYVIKSLMTYYQYWTICGGRFLLQSSIESDNSAAANPTSGEASRQAETIAGTDGSGSPVESQSAPQVS